MATGVDSTNSTPRHEQRVFGDGPADIEAQFLHAVDFGDVSQVKEILEGFPGLNVDCTDALGRTPLRLAVKNENKEVRSNKARDVLSLRVRISLSAVRESW